MISFCPDSWAAVCELKHITPDFRRDSSCFRIGETPEDSVRTALKEKQNKTKKTHPTLWSILFRGRALNSLGRS